MTLCRVAADTSVVMPKSFHSGMICTFKNVRKFSFSFYLSPAAKVKTATASGQSQAEDDSSSDSVELSQSLLPQVTWS